MWSLAWIPFLAGLGYALPQSNACVTTTSEVVVPTNTITYTTTPVETIHATGAQDLGTFTQIETVSSTKTLETITSITSVCGATGVITVPAETTTIYTNAPAKYKRALGLNPRDGCTVTVTSTTTYGDTYVFVAGTSTSTYTAFTAYTQATVTSTKYNGKAYEIATASATTSTLCGESTVTQTDATSTVTLDARCSPSAIISEYDGFGILYTQDHTSGGADYRTTTDNASDCCQLCAEAEKCAASAWDIRTGLCKLEFPVSYDTGDLSCGTGVYGMYGAGPDHPLAPGSGYYIAKVCGDIAFFNAPPDDGT